MLREKIEQASLGEAVSAPAFPRDRVERFRVAAQHLASYAPGTMSELPDGRTSVMEELRAELAAIADRAAQETAAAKDDRDFELWQIVRANLEAARNALASLIEDHGQSS